MSARWSLGVLIGLPILGLVLLICLVVFVLGILFWRSERKKKDTAYSEAALGAWFSVGAFGVALLALIIAGIAYWPWQADYHKWQPTSGTVTDISSRFLGDGKSTTQRFVVTLDGIGQRACDDTRCSLVHKGDVLFLSCKRSYQFAGTAGYDCNYVKNEPTP